MEQWEFENAFLAARNRQDADELLLNANDKEDFMVSKHDLDGKYSSVSDSCIPFIGYEPDELVGQSPYDYFHPEDYQTILKSHAKVTIRPEVDRVEYRLRTPDGRYKNVISLSRTIKSDNGEDFIFVLTFNRS
jgi:PAS domain S-box-containing protein